MLIRYISIYFINVYFRLDFDNLILSQPTAQTGICSTEGDTLVATSPTGVSPPSNVCGTLTGQHSKDIKVTQSYQQKILDLSQTWDQLPACPIGHVTPLLKSLYTHQIRIPFTYIMYSYALTVMQNIGATWCHKLAEFKIPPQWSSSNDGHSAFPMCNQKIHKSLLIIEISTNCMHDTEGE